MKKYFILIVLTISIFSCNKQKTNFEQNLINNKWYYYPGEKIKHNIKFVSYIKFYEDNTCKNFYSNSNIEFSAIEVKNNTGQWDYNKKTNKIEIFGIKFQIISEVNDTILMEKLEGHSKVLLFKYKNAH